MLGQLRPVIIAFSLAILPAAAFQNSDPGCPRYPSAIRTEQLDILDLDRAFQQFASRARRSQVGAKLSATTYTNFIDQRLFDKMAADKVTPAPRTTDVEFLRRAYIDLTGRIPTPEAAQAFFDSTEPGKRAKLIDQLLASPAYTDQLTTFWANKFKVTRSHESIGTLGRNAFYEFLRKSIADDRPYDSFARELLSAAGEVDSVPGTQFFARWMDVNGPVQDSWDDITDKITTTFLGYKTECISCHNGRAHLEKINLWLAGKKRTDVWRQAAFFGKTYVAPVYGRIPEFLVKDSEKGYDPRTKSLVRLPRYKAAVEPAFLLTGEGLGSKPGEGEREAYARMLTSDPQFARAAVNLVWSKLMGRGIVDPPFGFDLARQDPANPPPAPWTIQPSDPELLNALAADFRQHRYDLRRLMRLIVSSRAYQLSSVGSGEWKESHDHYFARHLPRRLSAEEFWDAVSDATGIYEKFKVKDLDRPFRYVMEASFNQDFASSHASIWNLLQEWGQTDREDPPTDRSSVVQAASTASSGKANSRRIGDP